MLHSILFVSQQLQQLFTQRSLTQLELPPQPITELQALAALPSIKQLRFKYRYNPYAEFYMQAPQMHTLRELLLLTSLTIEGDVQLRPGALKVLEDLPGLQVLSLPAGYSLPQQVTDTRLPESLTALSITGIRLDADSWNWLQQLSAIQTVFLHCCLLHWELLDYRCLECLICTSNLRSVELSIDYSQNTVNVLRALSKLISLSALNLSAGWVSGVPQLGCPGKWLSSLKSVSSLHL